MYNYLHIKIEHVYIKNQYVYNYVQIDNQQILNMWYSGEASISYWDMNVCLQLRVLRQCMRLQVKQTKKN